jgi:polyisoprenoid-binding protein YceI
MLTIAKLAAVAALSILATSLSFGQAEGRQVDPAHSTADLSLVSSNNGALSLDVGIAMVAGRMTLNKGKPAESSLYLSLYPARQQSRLLKPDGEFRGGVLAELGRYTLMSFQSRQAAATAEHKIAFSGDLTVVHVQRESNVAWNDAYSGSVTDEPRIDKMTREVTFVVDVASLQNSQATGQNFEITAVAGIERRNFPGFVSALRDSDWPVVVLDEKCEMPYYPALTARDYSGPVCMGKAIETRPSAEVYYAIPNKAGTKVWALPTGDELEIVAHLQLEPTGSAGSRR